MTPKHNRNYHRSDVGSIPRSHSIWIVTLMCLLCLTWVVVAQQPGGGEAPKKEAPAEGTSPLDELAVKQGKIADKYARLEQLLIRMSELEAISNPQRAALLKRAAQQSSNKLTRQQLNSLVKLLAPPAQLKRAVDEQQQVVTDLKALLELLQSENRADRLKSEQSRIKDYIKEVDRLIRLQQGVQGRTEGGDDVTKLAKDQDGIANRTDQLAKRIQETEEGKNNKEKSSGENKSNDSKSDQDKSGDKSGDKSKDGDKSSPKSQDGKKGKGESDKGKKNDGGKNSGDKSDSDKKDSQEKSENDKSDQKSSEADKSDQQKSDQQKSDDAQKTPGGQKSPDSKKSPGNSKKSGSKQKQSPMPGEPSESPDSEQQQDQQQQQEQEQSNPARKRLQAAEDRMRQAEKKLQEAKQKDATEEQEKALEELTKAKAELEQILRQMREEEIERTLALLEGRFRRMLESQMKIYESTKRLDKIPVAERTRDVDIQSSKLGFEEGKLAVDADKALMLLREEGSSVAFPETVELVRDDMQHVAERLSNTQIDKVTQSLEDEIIQSLEELVAALQKAQQDMKDKKKPPPNRPQQPMDPSDRPLVDQLAELKMIRSLQMRVNTRTQRYSRLLEDIEDPVGRANDADLHQSLVKLAELEKRVHEITRNLVLGKNE